MCPNFFLRDVIKLKLNPNLKEDFAATIEGLVLSLFKIDEKKPPDNDHLLF